MEYKTLTTKEFERYDKNRRKIYRHFCLLPVLLSDYKGDTIRRRKLFLEYCYKVLTRENGNTFWRYYKDKRKAIDKAKSNNLY